MQISQKTLKPQETNRGNKKENNGHFWTKNIINKKDKQKAEIE